MWAVFIQIFPTCLFFGHGLAKISFFIPGSRLPLSGFFSVGASFFFSPSSTLQVSPVTFDYVF